jgi:hypothetical protein
MPVAAASQQHRCGETAGSGLGVLAATRDTAQHRPGTGTSSTVPNIVAIEPCGEMMPHLLSFLSAVSCIEERCFPVIDQQPSCQLS